MKGCGEKPHLWLGRYPPQLEPETTRSVDQCFTHRSTGVIVSSMCTYVKSHQACAHTFKHIYFVFTIIQAYKHIC